MIVSNLGRMAYLEALAVQYAARDRVLAGGDDECLLVEHDVVVTLGRRGGAVDRAALARLATPVVTTDRGGFATWHGPGQLVVYPIVDTRRARLAVPALVERLGRVMIAIADALGLTDVTYDPERPGVYRGEKKLGSIGLHLSHGVTTHGFALNIDNSLDGFRAIVPCGLADLAVSTLALELGGPVPYAAAVAHALRLVNNLVQSTSATAREP